MLNHKRIFLTGGAGFIGSTLIGELVERNRIFVYDNFSRDSLAQRQYGKHKNLVRIEGDVLDAGHLAQAMASANPHLVVHLAAIVGEPACAIDEQQARAINLGGTLNALEAAQHDLCWEKESQQLIRLYQDILVPSRP